jgi:TRAP-type C4-dicarboxylate transport system substrate-binding protein
VFAENARTHGSDPAALKMVISGELDFFTLMGGILGQAVPVAEAQQVPFAGRDCRRIAPIVPRLFDVRLNRCQPVFLTASASMA